MGNGGWLGGGLAGQGIFGITLPSWQNVFFDRAGITKYRHEQRPGLQVINAAK